MSGDRIDDGPFQKLLRSIPMPLATYVLIATPTVALFWLLGRRAMDVQGMIGLLLVALIPWIAAVATRNSTPAVTAAATGIVSLLHPSIVLMKGVVLANAMLVGLLIYAYMTVRTGTDDDEEHQPQPDEPSEDVGRDSGSLKRMTKSVLIGLGIPVVLLGVDRTGILAFVSFFFISIPVIVIGSIIGVAKASPGRRRPPA